jgi:hypothetical protein
MHFSMTRYFVVPHRQRHRVSATEMSIYYASGLLYSSSHAHPPSGILGLYHTLRHLLIQVDDHLADSSSRFQSLISLGDFLHDNPSHQHLAHTGQNKETRTLKPNVESINTSPPRSKNVYIVSNCAVLASSIIHTYLLRDF